MGKLIVWTPIKTSSGEIVAPRYNADGELEEAVIFYVDTVGVYHSLISTGFVHVPINWRIVWADGKVVPVGAHSYLDPEEFGLVGFAAQQELHDAHLQRMKAGSLQQGQPVENPIPVDITTGESIPQPTPGPGGIISHEEDTRPLWQILGYKNEDKWIKDGSPTSKKV